MYGRQVPLGPFHATLVRKLGQSLPAKDELTRHSDQYTNPSPRVQNGFGHPPDIIVMAHIPLSHHQNSLPSKHSSSAVFPTLTGSEGEMIMPKKQVYGY
jgi:hypothetical protein